MGCEAVNYELVAGFETHIELQTKTKIFCGCTTQFGGEPNTHCCPVCIGLPGTLPVLNREVVRYAIVGDNEADPLRNRISDESEVGRTLIGASLGETVEIPLDGYTLAYLVQSIEKGAAL